MSMIRNIVPRVGLRRAFIQTSITPIRYQSTGGYGDQGGDPISNNPQDQGPRPRIDTEHPGPEPVAEGRGKSGVKGKPVPEETHGTAGENSGSMSNAQASAMHRASRFPNNSPLSQTSSFSTTTTSTSTTVISSSPTSSPAFSTSSSSFSSPTPNSNPKYDEASDLYGYANKGNPQPKINAQSKPEGEGSEAVQKHNEEMRTRPHSEVAQDNERVGKGFWNRSGDETA